MNRSENRSSVGGAGFFLSRRTLLGASGVVVVGATFVPASMAEEASGSGDETAVDCSDTRLIAVSGQGPDWALILSLGVTRIHPLVGTDPQFLEVGPALAIVPDDCEATGFEDTADGIRVFGARRFVVSTMTVDVSTDHLTESQLADLPSNWRERAAQTVDELGWRPWCMLIEADGSTVEEPVPWDQSPGAAVIVAQHTGPDGTTRLLVETATSSGDRRLVCLAEDGTVTAASEQVVGHEPVFVASEPGGAAVVVSGGVGEPVSARPAALGASGSAPDLGPARAVPLAGELDTPALGTGGELAVVTTSGSGAATVATAPVAELPAAHPTAAPELSVSTRPVSSLAQVTGAETPTWCYLENDHLVVVEA